MRYRIAIRYVDGGQRYHIEDVDAPTMAAALRAVLDRVPESLLDVADLAEVRRQVSSDEERDYSPG